MAGLRPTKHLFAYSTSTFCKAALYIVKTPVATGTQEEQKDCSMNKTISALLCALLLAGCFGSSSNKKTPSAADALPTEEPRELTQELVQELEEQGVLPRLNRDNTLLGPDDNNNGIRDDIDAMLAKRYTDERELKAAEQMARAMQSVFTVDLENIIAVKEVNRQISRANTCIYSVFDPESEDRSAFGVGSDLQAMTYNTRNRLRHYMQFNRALSGTSWGKAKEDTCE